MSPPAIFTPCPKDAPNFFSPMLFDVLLENRFDRLGQDGVEHLPLAELMTAHQIQLQLAQRRTVEVPQVADSRDGGTLTQAERTVAAPATIVR